MKRALAACAIAVLVAVAGCSSTASQPSGADPAAVAPAGTLAYASFDMAPQGAEKAGFEAAFGKLLGTDPEAKIGDAFTQAVQTSGKLDWATDVQPWLAGPVAVALTGVSDHSLDFALLMPSSDDGKAQAAIDKDLSGVNVQGRTYRDVSYKVQADGTANGIVSHVVVAGTEPAFKAVVDAVKDGKTLAGSDQWKTTVGQRGDGKVGLAYLDAKALLQSLASNLQGAQRLAAPFVLGMLDLHPFVATLDAQPDSLVVDVTSPGTKPDPRGPAAASSPMIESFPANALLALALPNVGQALGKLAASLSASPLIAAQVAGLVDQVRSQTGIDLQKDVIAGLGDIGLFARGATPKRVTAVLVARPAKPGSLANVMKRVPALIAARSAGRARVTSRASGFDVRGQRGRARLLVRTGVQAKSRLGDTVLFKKAAALIGQRPTVFVNFAPALALAAQAPHHKRNAEFKAALPHLKHIEFIAAGARRDDGLDVLRGVVGIR